MNTDGEARTATDVICCVYLARVAQRQGRPDAAQRWQAKADRWLERQRTSSSPETTRNTRKPDPGSERRFW
jgi:hypothetical protein